jgi:hypothetical protein
MKNFELENLLFTENDLKKKRMDLMKLEKKRNEIEIRIESMRVEIAELEKKVLMKNGYPKIPNDYKPNIFPKSTLIDSNINDVNTVLLGAIVTCLVDMGVTAWERKKRASAVEIVLAAAEGKIHRQVITEALRRVGRFHDTVEDVAAALSYLQRKGKAQSVGDGYWVHSSRYGKSKKLLPKGGGDNE